MASVSCFPVLHGPHGIRLALRCLLACFYGVFGSGRRTNLISSSYGLWLERDIIVLSCLLALIVLYSYLSLYDIWGECKNLHEV